MSDTPRGKHRLIDGDYVVAASRAFLAACVVYMYVRGLFAIVTAAGEWQGMVFAVGTGTLLGIVMEWLRRRGY